MAETQDYIDIVFDGPPSNESGRFVEVENSDGCSISVGEWIDRCDGTWALRLTQSSITSNQGVRRNMHVFGMSRADYENARANGTSICSRPIINEDGSVDPNGASL